VRKSLVLLAIGLLMDAAPTVPAAHADWTSLPPLPEARYGAAGSGLNGMFFVLGGRGTTDMANATVWNDASQSWGEAQAMSQVRVLGASAGTGSSVFAVGGYDDNGMPSAAAERLDLSSGSWTALPAMPVARVAMGAAVAGGQLYIAGGETNGSALEGSALRFDPGTNAWSAVASLPTPRTGVAAASLGGRVWIMGGRAGSLVATVEVFDPVSGAWSAGPDLPEPLWLPAAAAFQNRVWVMGGIDASFARSNRVYSAGQDGVWRVEAQLPEPLAASSVGVVDNALVVAGGLAATGRPTTSVYAFAVAPPPPPPPPPPADTLHVRVWLNPDHLNATTQGTWITGHIEPQGFPIEDVDASSVRLDGVSPDGPSTIEDSDHNGINELMAKFSRAAFVAKGDGTWSLALQATTTTGKPVAGVVTLEVAGTGTAAGKHKHALRMAAIRSGDGRSLVQFTLDRGSDVVLEVIDLQGRVVERVEKGFLSAGLYQRTWPSHPGAAAGTYFARLRAANTEDMVRVSVLH